MTASGEFRNLMTFGAEQGRPSTEFIQRFQAHALSLTTDVALGVQRAFFDQNHDMSKGADPFFLIDGLVIQAAAELWAAERILVGKMAPLTMFHHARSIYEAHATVHWLLEDLDGRWKRIIKGHVRERQRFENEATHTFGGGPTDITAEGLALLADNSIKFPPTMFDMVRNDRVLRYDLGFLWKYSSIHIHPGGIGSGQIDPDNERIMIEQILGGLIRHTAGTFREVINRYPADAPDTLAALEAAEGYSAYKFELPNLSEYPPA